MKQRSLKTKLLLLTMGLFLSSGLAMTLMQSSSLQSLRSDIMAQTRSALEQEVSRTLQFQAERYAVQIGALLQQSYQVPLGIAAQLEGSMAQPDRALSRPQVETLLGSRLQQASGISSIYAQFEADGYDGQDASGQSGDLLRPGPGWPGLATASGRGLQRGQVRHLGQRIWYSQQRMVPVRAGYSSPLPDGTLPLRDKPGQPDADDQPDGAHPQGGQVRWHNRCRHELAHFPAIGRKPG